MESIDARCGKQEKRELKTWLPPFAEPCVSLAVVVTSVNSYILAHHAAVADLLPKMGKFVTTKIISVTIDFKGYI